MKTEINTSVEVTRKSFIGYGIELRPVATKDLIILRRWRNSSKISPMQIDRSYINPQKQRKWFENIQNSSDQGHWVVWREQKKTGYMKISGATKGRALNTQEEVDVGAYVGDSMVRVGLLGYAVALMQLSIVFDYLSIPTIRSKIWENNHRSRKFNNRLGYQEESTRNGIVVVTHNRTAFKKAEETLSRYFNDPLCRPID